MLVFGVNFGLAALVGVNEPDFDVTAAVLMWAFALVCMGAGTSLVTARAAVSEQGIRYRYGVVRRRIAASEIQSVEAGPGSGAYYERICVHVKCRDRRRPVRLVALQRPETTKGRAATEQQARKISEALHL